MSSTSWNRELMTCFFYILDNRLAIQALTNRLATRFWLHRIQVDGREVVCAYQLAKLELKGIKGKASAKDYTPSSSLSLKDYGEEMTTISCTGVADPNPLME